MATARTAPPAAADATLPRLDATHWPADAYDRARLPERVLQFGTGMLLRALPAALVDAANRRGEFGGRIVVVQSTAQGVAPAMNAQDGLFTLVERGMEHGAPVERTRLVGSIARALVATDEWAAVRDVAVRPELRVIVSNVTEAGFRIDDEEDAGIGAGLGAHDPDFRGAPSSYPAKLTDLLYARFRRAPDAPPLFVVPTELVDDNGPQLRFMVEQLSVGLEDAHGFRAWLGARVRFCSSLVDRITTGAPAPELRAALESQLGYADALLTVAEPYALWAVEGDPDELRDAFAIDGGAPTDGGGEPPVIFARDIRTFRERKIRLLNGAHTALAPLARLAGVRTVHDAVHHAQLGPFLRRVLFDEIVPSIELPRAAAEAFAASVLDRFGNPWLDHQWSVIATNQTAKMRLRVVPSIVAYAAKHGAVPEGLALALAGYLRHARSTPAPDRAGAGTGSWRGASYDLADADLAAVVQHWRAAERSEALVPGVVAAPVLRRLVDHALADEALWGARLADVPGLAAATGRWLTALETDGVAPTLAALAAERPSPGAASRA